MINLTNNTSDLRDILSAVQALPDAGSGGITPSGTIQIAENGTHDVTAYASAEVNVPPDEPVLQNKTITENGTYSADAGYDGLGTVEVNVPSSGGAEVYYSGMGQMYTPNMVIPNGGMRYVRDHFQNAVHLVSFIQQYGTPSSDSDYGLFRGCTALETVWVSRATCGAYFFSMCSALKTITLGRVGLAVTKLDTGMWDHTVENAETITCYVNATTLAEIPTAVSGRILPSASPNATIIYKNSTTGEVLTA